MRALCARTGQTQLALALVTMLAGCGEDEAPDDVVNPVRAPEIARILPAEEALAGTQVSKLDPATMNDAEIRKAIGTGPRCEFRYTSAGRPVLAASMQPNEPPSGGVTKLNGSLIPLTAASTEGVRQGTFQMIAGPIRITLAPDQEQEEDHDGVLRREANMVVEVGQSLRVGYRGYFDCTSEPPVKSSRH